MALTSDEIKAVIADGLHTVYVCGHAMPPEPVPDDLTLSRWRAECVSLASSDVQFQIAALRQQVDDHEEQLMSLSITAPTFTRAETAPKTAAYAMVAADSIVPADTTAGAFNVTLPPGNTVPTNVSGDMLYVLWWKAGTSPPSFVPASGDTMPQGSPFAVQGQVGSTLSGKYDPGTKTWTLY